MDPRVSFITLAVADLEQARRFFLDGLGWRAELDVPGEVIMIRVGERLILSLWAEPGFEAEVGPIRRGEGLVPITLAHNVATPAEVDAVLDAARAAGAPEVGDAVRRDWGGYSGYFADPAGFRWEVAFNPGPIGLSVLPESLAPPAADPSVATMAAAGLADWRELAGALQACFRTDTYARAVTVVDRIAELADSADHHPELTLGYAEVRLRLWSHDVGAITDRDLQLARAISEAAAELGARSDPASLTEEPLA